MKNLKKGNIILFLLLMTCLTLHAQSDILFVDSGATIHVIEMDGTNPTLFVSGELVIDTGAKVFNKQGRIDLKKITKHETGQYQSTGEEHFYGNSTAVVTGTSSFTDSSYFGHIFKDNNAKFESTVSLDCNTFTFTAPDPARLVTIGDTLFVKSSDHDAILGYGANSFFDLAQDSYLKRAIDTTGVQYEYPLGKIMNPNSSPTYHYRVFNLKPQSLGITGSSTVMARLRDTISGQVNYYRNFSTGFSGGFGSPCAVGPNGQIFELGCNANEGWSLIGPPDHVNVVFGYVPNPCGSQVGRVIKTDAGLNNWTADMENVVGDLAENFCLYSDWTSGATTIVGGAYLGFGDFTIAGGSVTALPVELLSLIATPIDNEYIRVSWETALEINNEKFVVTRSVDGYAFDSIGQKAGNGTITMPKSYSFNDSTVIPNVVYYYQLMQVDYDGHTENSPIVSAYLSNEQEGTISVFPNPTTGKIFVKYTGSNELLGTVYSVLGGRVLEIKGCKEFIVDLRGCADGVYFMDFVGNGSFKKIKVIKTAY